MLYNIIIKQIKKDWRINVKASRVKAALSTMARYEKEKGDKVKRFVIGMDTATFVLASGKIMALK